MSEEEIMRKRLTLEGDGGSDDKRIMSLVKTFVRWSQLTGLSEEDVDATYQKMLFTLGQCAYSFTKTKLVMAMNQQEMERYENVYREIERSIETAKQQICQYKEELGQARVIRRHRQEYDALAKVIQKQPPRQQSLENISKLEKKLKSLESNKEALKRKLELRKKQFHLLVQCVHQLQDSLEFGEEEEDMEEGEGQGAESQGEESQGEDSIISMDLDSIQ